MSYVEEFCEEIAIINQGNVVLAGNLKNIKKEFGKNRLSLSASNLTLEELEKVCIDKFSDLINIHEVKKDFIVLELCEVST
ncbi:MAG: ABC transporter ATP-binding protein, partial [Erysipelotrichaceae bacterium]